MAARVDVTSNIREVLKEVREMRERAADLEPALRPTVARLRAMIDATFVQSAAPDGKAWKALKPATVKQKKRSGYSNKPLVRRGARGLQGQTVVRADKDAIALGFGPLVPYGMYHQFGTKRTPKRPPLPIAGTPAAPTLMGGKRVAEIMKKASDDIARYLFGKRGER